MGFYAKHNQLFFHMTNQYFFLQINFFFKSFVSPFNKQPACYEDHLWQNITFPIIWENHIFIQMILS